MLLEIMGESISQGSVGSINFGVRERYYRSKGFIVFKIILAVICFTALIYWYLQWHHNWLTNLKVVAGFVAYLLAGYYIHPVPDTSNLGWFGGLINNPFRYSDDINWLLILMKTFLFPACFLTYSVVDFIRLILADASLIQPERINKIARDKMDKKKFRQTKSVLDASSYNNNEEIALVCPNGHNFSVSRLYSGTLRRCSVCEEKTQVP